MTLVNFHIPSRKKKDFIFSISNPLIDKLPFPDSFNYHRPKEHPDICYNPHPIMGTKIFEIQMKKENIIFNDIVQEGYLCFQDKIFLSLAKKYIDDSKSTEKIVENLLHIIKESDFFFKYLNKLLRGKITKTFLGSLIFTLNNAIRRDFLNFISTKKVFRKAFLSQFEINEYYKIFRSPNKRFCWNSFASCYPEMSPFLIDCDYYYNVIFSIEFVMDAFGVEIGKFSSLESAEEVLLPAMSLFEILKIDVIIENKGMKILNIELLKIDQNKLKQLKKVSSETENYKKISKVVENELMLLNN